MSGAKKLINDPS
ncbi:hypothetical protein CLOP_g21701, partial [Closterium sp. NIES-67]